jgi:uncharacterized protein with von Willebrand factor type A (vWA) domain
VKGRVKGRALRLVRVESVREAINRKDHSRSSIVLFLQRKLLEYLEAVHKCSYRTDQLSEVSDIEDSNRISALKLDSIVTVRALTELIPSVVMNKQSSDISTASIPCA